MRIPLPELKFESDSYTIEQNVKKIREFRKLLQGALKALDGLNSANQGMCSHPNKAKRYDPGYAGGGFSHDECLICGYCGIIW